MDYEVTLIEAEIEGPMKGKMALGLARDGGETARVEYSWTDKEFVARFVGNAAALPCRLIRQHLFRHRSQPFRR